MRRRDVNVVINSQPVVNVQPTMFGKSSHQSTLSCAVTMTRIVIVIVIAAIMFMVLSS